MRGLIPGLETPHPLYLGLPAVFHDDDFALRFVSAFDDALAPIFATLDSLDAYFDPALAPDDFVEWLGSWMGFSLDESWASERRRSLVSRAVSIYRNRGTLAGLAEHIALVVGVEPEVSDSGGSTWSPTPGGALPGSPAPSVLVRVRAADLPEGVDERRLSAIIEEIRPAHVAVEVEVAGA